MTNINGWDAHSSPIFAKVKFVLFFGSYPKGNPGSGSDPQFSELNE